MKTRHTSTHKICLVLIQSNLLEKLLKEYSISLFTRNWPDQALHTVSWSDLPVAPMGATNPGPLIVGESNMAVGKGSGQDLVF